MISYSQNSFEPSEVAVALLFHISYPYMSVRSQYEMFIAVRDEFKRAVAEFLRLLRDRNCCSEVKDDFFWIVANGREIRLEAIREIGFLVSLHHTADLHDSVFKMRLAEEIDWWAYKYPEETKNYCLDRKIINGNRYLGLVRKPK